ncbi:hypothetical protein NDU88_001263 [Pleurodeles waltl]|uniref:Uncharacterized protein n=1 Tax=Pleurodeles waltl TaxID=8319 RepID=A0AAV7P7E7_PLEWA|nr:hypothetical protein NDU88_001263 [Pleurodeles waltl]
MTHLHCSCQKIEKRTERGLSAMTDDTGSSSVLRPFALSCFQKPRDAQPTAVSQGQEQYLLEEVCRPHDKRRTVVALLRYGPHLALQMHMLQLKIGHSKMDDEVAGGRSLLDVAADR